MFTFSYFNSTSTTDDKRRTSSNNLNSIFKIKRSMMCLKFSSLNSLSIGLNLMTHLSRLNSKKNKEKPVFSSVIFATLTILLKKKMKKSSLFLIKFLNVLINSVQAAAFKKLKLLEKRSNNYLVI